MKTEPPVNQLFDERGVLIEDRDILKVYHFRSHRRRERIYMYKQVRTVNGWLVGHHLTGPDFDGTTKNTYNLIGKTDGVGRVNIGKIAGTRVVQSKNWEKLHK